VTSGNMSGGGGNNNDPGFDQAINGTMPYFSSYLVDGGSIWLPHSANTDQGISESVSELNVIATDAPSQYGGGGSVFNVILKSGGSAFHGSAYDYIQNDAFDARNYFNTGAKAKQPLQLLRRVAKRADREEQNVLLLQLSTIEKPQQRVQHGFGANCSHEGRLLQSCAFGNALALDAAHGGTPLTTNPTQCAAFEPDTDLAIPTADFDPVAAAIQSNYYLASKDGNSVLSNNYTYLAPGNGDLAKQIGRLDYNITPKNRIDFSIIERYTPVVVATSSPNCPVNCNNNSSDGGERAALRCVDHQCECGQRSAFFV